MRFDVGGVGLLGRIALIAHVLRRPDIQPLGEGHFGWLKVVAVIHGGYGLGQLLPDFLLGLSVDAFADRLAGARIVPGYEAGLPGAVRALPDASGALRRSGIRFSWHCNFLLCPVE